MNVYTIEISLKAQKFIIVADNEGEAVEQAKMRLAKYTNIPQGMPIVRTAHKLGDELW